MEQHKRDKLAYQLGFDYLLRFSKEGVTREVIKRYLTYNEAIQRPTSLPGLYERLLTSAQEANLKSGVIGKAIGGVENLGVVLHQFDPNLVIDTFGTDWERVLQQIKRQLKPHGKIRETSRSVWPQYCRTILTGGEFFAQFSNADEFYRWADFFDKDPKSRLALPLIISSEVIGMGFALACDFLKEVGYINFGKPDVHIKEIFTGLELCAANANDVQVFKVIIRIAENVGVTPYGVDKLFWLVGSGNFHYDVQIGNGGKIRTDKQAFIANSKKQLK